MIFNPVILFSPLLSLNCFSYTVVYLSIRETNDNWIVIFFITLTKTRNNFAETSEKYKLDRHEKRLRFNTHDILFAEANGNSSYWPCPFMDGDCHASKQGRSRNLHKAVLYPTLKLLIGLIINKVPKLHKATCIKYHTL